MYNISFTPSVPGTYKMDVKIRGKSINGCPKSITVTDGLDITKSTLQGPSELNEDVSAQFLITPRNHGNQTYKINGSDLKVTVESQGSPIGKNI